MLYMITRSVKCKPSITSANGTAASKELCSGSLIFEENFDQLDKQKWQPEVSFWGGGVSFRLFSTQSKLPALYFTMICFSYQNEEFQWYVAEDENSFVQNGKLHIKPTLTSSKIGRYQVENGYIFLDDCTDTYVDNCERKAGGNIIINPVRSAHLNTKNSFSFKYGRVEVIAKAPTGDWLWPGWYTFFAFGNKIFAFII